MDSGDLVAPMMQQPDMGSFGGEEPAQEPMEAPEMPMQPETPMEAPEMPMQAPEGMME
jgi:hypothetical protein